MATQSCQRNRPSVNLCENHKNYSFRSLVGATYSSMFQYLLIWASHLVNGTVLLTTYSFLMQKKRREERSCHARPESFLKAVIIM